MNFTEAKRLTCLRAALLIEDACEQMSAWMVEHSAKDRAQLDKALADLLAELNRRGHT